MKCLKLSFLVMLVVILGLTQSVFAETPEGCNTNALSISIMPYILGSPTFGPVAQGDVITYHVTLSVPTYSIPPELHCNFYGGQLSVTLPDGNYVEVAGFGGTTPDVPTVSEGSPFVIDVDYTVTAADVAAGLIQALTDYGCTARYPLQINGTFDDPSQQQTASATTSNRLPVECPEPCVEITKSVDCEVSKVGDEVVYTICIENCGDFPLIDVVVTDPRLDSGPLAGFPSVLAPDQNVCVDFPYTIQPGDAPGPVENQAHVEAIDECDGETPVSDDSQFVLVELVDPNLEVRKSCLEEPVLPGGIATFEVEVENTGNVCLEVEVNEPDAVSPCGPFTLAPGEIETCQAEIAVPQDSIEPVINTVSATWTICEPPRIPGQCLDNTGTVEAMAECEVSCPEPCVEVTMTSDCEETAVGMMVTYTVCVENCGDSNLVDVVVIDDIIGTLTGFPSVLEPGDPCCLQFQYQVHPGDDPGPLVNQAHVSAIDDGNGTMHLADDSKEIVIPIVHPCLELTKSCLTEGGTEPGGVVFFRICLNNCGDVDLLVDVNDLDSPDCYAEGLLLIPDQNTCCELSIDVPPDTTASEIINRVYATWSILDGGECLDNTGRVDANATCPIGGIEVPNVVGMNQADANIAIIDAGLTVGEVSHAISDTVHEGYVISQDPPDGTLVPLGSTVDLVISLGHPIVTIYVDNDAPNDPEPNNPDISDAVENGSTEHPFDAIQKAINAASDDDTVIVLPGTYTGTGNRDIDFNGKTITVRSSNPDDPNIVASTIIDCQGTEAEPHRAFYFHTGEDQASVVHGLTIINGYAP
jgi:uncharacterized repeat protein (TIGR01451 family)